MACELNISRWYIQKRDLDIYPLLYQIYYGTMTISYETCDL